MKNHIVHIEPLKKWVIGYTWNYCQLLSFVDKSLANWWTTNGGHNNYCHYCSSTQPLGIFLGGP